MAPRPLAEILAEAEDPAHHRVESAFILQRQDLDVALSELQAERRAALRRAGDSLGSRELADIDKQIAALEAEIADVLVEFKFRPLSYQALTALTRKHPPTKEQKNAGFGYNPDTYDIALLAACCVDPVGTEDDFRRLAASYSPAQFQVLLATCTKVNMGGASLPKAVAARLGLTPRSNAPSDSSASETDEESPPASSSGE